MWDILSRAVNTSLLIAAVLVFPSFALASYELWFVAPGEGYLNSDQMIPIPETDKLRHFAFMVAFLPVPFAVVAAIILLVQLPFLLWRIVFHGRSPGS